MSFAMRAFHPSTMNTVFKGPLPVGVADQTACSSLTGAGCACEGAGMPAVYFVATYDIADWDRYERDYVPGVVATLAATGGEVGVALGSPRPLEGPARGYTVIFRFPSKVAFSNWYDGDA